jgi:hypothetical protein
MPQEIGCPLEYGLNIFGGNGNQEYFVYLLQMKLCVMEKSKKEFSNITDAVLTPHLKK